MSTLDTDTKPSENQRRQDLEVLQKLTRILKWGLYSILEGIYFFWIGTCFALIGPLVGFLSILCIVAVHPLRWLWDDAEDVRIIKETDPRVAAFQQILKLFFGSTVVVCDLAIVALVFFAFKELPSHLYWTAGAVASIAVTELLHLKIRSVNRGMADLRHEIYGHD
jgi:hypothetical protein